MLKRTAGWSFFSAAAIPIWSLAAAGAAASDLWTVRVRMDARRSERAAGQGAAGRAADRPAPSRPGGDTA